MSSLVGNIRVKQARDTAGNWTSNNPIPLAGQSCLETDTGKVKIGDGSTAWTSLPYSIDTAAVAASIATKLTGTTAQLCKAWVNFDGTTNVGGFCTIRDSYNVTSVSFNTTGEFTINFTNEIALGYTLSGSGSADATGAVIVSTSSDATALTTSVRLYVTTDGGTPVNRTVVSSQIFGS